MVQYVRYILLAVLLSSCCPKIDKEPIVRMDTLYVPVGFTDTITVTKQDSFFVAGKTVYLQGKTVHDTLMQYIVRPKHDTIKVPYPDTITVYKEIKQRSVLDGITLRDVVIAGAIVVFIIIPLLYFFFRRK